MERLLQAIKKKIKTHKEELSNNLLSKGVDNFSEFKRVYGYGQGLDKSLEIIKPGMSLAGVETTVNFPIKTSHGLLTQKERENQGIGDKLIRLSVGIEDYQDLYDDLDNAIIKSIK